MLVVLVFSSSMARDWPENFGTRKSESPVQFSREVVPVDKIGQDRWMKVRLQDTIGAVHPAEGTDMKDHVSAAGIGAGSRALSDKSPHIARQQQDLFAFFNGIVSL